MTAPVMMRPDGKKNEESDTLNGVMTFFLPASKYTRVEQAPIPVDERVKLRQVEPRTIAAFKFTWKFDDKECAKKLAILKASLAEIQSSSPETKEEFRLADDAPASRMTYNGLQL